MKYDLYLHHVELTDFDRDLLEKKLDRLKKHVVPPYALHIAFERNTHHRDGAVIACRLRLTGTIAFHVERSNDSVQNSLDEALDALKQELLKEHDKKKNAHIS